jgi:hypothetical protein
MNKAIDMLCRKAALHRFWERNAQFNSVVSAPVTASDWNEQLYYLSASGIGTEEALSYLLQERPSFDTFLSWLQNTYRPGIVDMQPPTGNVLSREDHDFWNDNGYLLVKNAVTKVACENARSAIWEFLGADPESKDSWYLPHEGKKGLMLNLFQHPALDSIRRSPRIRRAYEELYGHEDIYLLVDKVSFNPPETSKYRFMGSPLHWDVSLQQPIPFVLQGLLYLNDVDETDGAFHCVPGFHRNGGGWLASLPGNVNAREVAQKELTPAPVPGKAGDLVIWHQALPHCATANKGIVPRMVQYIAYKPMIATESATWI